MNILLFSGLYDHKLISKIAPISNQKKVKNIFLVRNRPLEYEKIRSFTPPRILNILILREIYKFFAGLYLCIFKKVDYVCGIFLRPHVIFAFILGKLFQKPFIPILIGNDVDFCLKHNRIFRNLLLKAHYLGVRGTHSKNRINAVVKNEQKIFIHHNIYPLNLEPKGVQTKKDIDVLCIADFSKVKRVDIFLDVLVQLREKRPSISAVMLGGGWKGFIYKTKTKKMKLTNNVRFKGKVENVASYLDRSRVFLMTSQAEGLPMSMLEAMSAGVPCVVPNVGDIPDIALDGKNAFVVEPLRIKEFADKVLRLLENPDLAERFSTGAIDTLRDKEDEFSLSYNTKVWRKILD